MVNRLGIILSALIACVVAAATTSSAQTQTETSVPTFSAVVELFTSQGCSSCPPADRLFKTYVDRPDVLALTFPVDYWDYLGWKDTFASSQNSKRQRDYANTRGDGAVYTPQAIVNGSLHMNGANKGRIDHTIEASPTPTLVVPVKIQRNGQTLIISTPAIPEEIGKGKCTVWLAMVQKRGDVPVRRGENGGNKLTYYNIVRSLTPVGMWEGGARTFKIPTAAVVATGYESLAVLIQRGISGPIIGAAWLGGTDTPPTH